MFSKGSKKMKYHVGGIIKKNLHFHFMLHQFGLRPFHFLVFLIRHHVLLLLHNQALNNCHSMFLEQKTKMFFECICQSVVFSGFFKSLLVQTQQRPKQRQTHKYFMIRLAYHENGLVQKKLTLSITSHFRGLLSLTKSLQIQVECALQKPTHVLCSCPS